MAKSAVRLVRQVIKDVCFSRYILAFVPFSNNESVLKLHFLCDHSNGILSADWFSFKKNTIFSFTSLYMKMFKLEVGKMGID